MKKVLQLVGFIVLATLLSHTPARAGIIYDHSPDHTGSEILIPNYLNVTDWTTRQWFADRFFLQQDTLISGIDIFGQNFDRSTIGRAAVIRIWADMDNTPGEMIYSYVSEITIQDSDGTASKPLLDRSFAPLGELFKATAGLQYWVGMAAVSTNLSLATFVSDDDNYIWLGREGDTFRGECTICGDMAFRLHGENIQAVPAPPTVMLLMLGFVYLIARRRLKSKSIYVTY